MDLKKSIEQCMYVERAVSMVKYMQDQFCFYGIPATQRRKSYREFLKAEKKKKTVDWNLLDACYEDEHRESQYFVYDYLPAMKKYLIYEDIPKIRDYSKTNPDWVCTFIEEHRSDMASLSIREAEKYL